MQMTDKWVVTGIEMTYSIQIYFNVCKCKWLACTITHILLHMLLMIILSWIQWVYCATMYTCQIEYCIWTSWCEENSMKIVKMYEQFQYIRCSLHPPLLNTLYLLLKWLTKRLEHNTTSYNIWSCCCSVPRWRWSYSTVFWWFCFVLLTQKY